MSDVTPDLIVRLLRLGVPFDERVIGKITRDSATGAWRVTNGYFDKDEQGWVETRNEEVRDEALPDLVRACTEAQVRGFLVNGFDALSFDAFLRGDAVQARAEADRARRVQDGAGVVAWRFAEVFQALAALLAGRHDEARALLSPIDGLTVWHAFAGPYGYALDAEHLRALWTGTQAIREALGLETYRPQENEAASRLRHLGVAETAYRLDRFRNAARIG